MDDFLDTHSSEHSDMELTEGRKFSCDSLEAEDSLSLPS